MKDIDFDELDRAVGSVLGTDSGADTTAKTATPTATTVADPDPATSVTSQSTSDSMTDDVEPVKEGVESTDSTEESSSTPEGKSAISPARKRGQFLDMVHPSADMRKSPKLSASSDRKTLTPISATVVPEAPESQPASTTAASEASMPTENVPDKADDVREAPKETSWPDPLDFEKESAEAAVTTQETSQPLAAHEPAQEVTQTPFVTDAKVDKRPLGAFAPQEEEVGSEDTTTEALAQPEEPKDEVPEFAADVNSIEAAGVPQTEDQPTGVTSEVPHEAPAVEARVEAAEISTPAVEAAPVPTEPQPAKEVEAPEQPAQPEAEAVAEPATPAPAAAAPVVGQAASIPQQYKAPGPQKEDSEARPLFDTEEYHQPLVADGKKKPTKIILIIVMLVVLLILGGALGYIAYNVGI